MVETTANFGGSIPEFYDSCMGPAWFEAYAADMAARLPANLRGDVLEIACGTGLVTRQLRKRLDPAFRLVASDISKDMLEYARHKSTDIRGITWREADAMKLPFGDAEFGAVVCAFGIMFMPDKRAMLREARRVLKDDGILLFNVWDRIEEIPHATVYAQVTEDLFPGDAEMRFRLPYEMYDPELLRQLLGETGFREQRIEKNKIQVGRVSARQLAQGQILGTPRSLLIEKRGVSVDHVVDRLTAALARVGGADPYRATVSAIIVEARAAA